MKNFLILLLALLPFLSLGQKKQIEDGFEPNGFTDKDNVFVGENCSFAIKNGVLWAWGSNESGELGNGTLDDQYVPTRIGDASNWSFIASRNGRTFGLQSDGSLWAWGKNYDLTNRKNQTTPIKIGGDAVWVNISLGYFHGNGIKSDGTLWAWGNNEGMQFGDGTTKSSEIPVQVGTDANWVKVSTQEFTLALKSDGTLWAWGRDLKKYYNGNEKGQLGLGHKKTVTTPTMITTNKKKWVAFCAGPKFSQAIDEDGKRWAWGSNGYFGELGFGELESTFLTPKEDTENTWKDVFCYGLSVFGIKNDNSIWHWGNGFGGATTSPKKLDKGFEIKKIAESYSHVIIIKTDGSLVIGGSNSKGELGIGTNDKIDSLVSPLNAEQIEVKLKEIAFKNLLDEYVAKDNAKFDSIIATKDKWDISGTYNLTSSECIKDMQFVKLIIKDESLTAGKHNYVIEEPNGNLKYIDFYVDDKDYPYSTKEQKKEQIMTLWSKQSFNNYGSNTNSQGIQFESHGKPYLLQDLRIKRGILKVTLHYEQFNTEKKVWEYIDCNFEGKIQL